MLFCKSLELQRCFNGSCLWFFQKVVSSTTKAKALSWQRRAKTLLCFLSPLSHSLFGKICRCYKLLHHLYVCLWCDQVIPSYCSILKTCQFLQQKKCLLCKGHFLWSYYRMSATSSAPWNWGISSSKVQAACLLNCGHLPRAAQVQRDCQGNKLVP